MENKVSLTLLLLATCLVTGGVSALSVDYYAKSCPNLEAIIKPIVVQKYKEEFVSGPGVLRILFHDCFVNGCDASVFLVSTGNNKAEKDSDENLSLPGDGFDAVIRAKRAVEAACPNTVSCADILQIVARDMVVQTRGPTWDVLKGRLDGRVSTASSVAGSLPDPKMTVDQLTAIFAAKGITQQDMVTLSGAHTFGFAHCDNFQDRFYNNPVDPTLNVSYATELKTVCPHGVDPTIVAFLDRNSPKKFDNVYYKNLQSGYGLLRSDQVLQVDARTRAQVKAFAKKKKKFFDAWKVAIVNLGNVGVKTGNQGEIRRDLNCAVIN
eukprot:TRINITY_DN10593_c0_g1_i1.p1 TRINITY_DN10593_c0_g1~~TRINITY_DN10593_c0_g1_i1.p1  ORF type:complete len:323 (+),score=39.46 TRINITY_DN10593_c0_g1_i1:306-1274(+)